MRKLFTFFLLFICTCCSALDPNHFTITRISAPYFIVDGNVPTAINKAYVGFEIKNNSNSATTYNNLKFTITSIGTSVAGQNYQVISPASGSTNIGTLAPGQSKTCYFYIQYPSSVTPQATFNINLSDLTASGKAQAFVIRNRSSISANAGGTATQTFTNQDIIGGLILDDVTYTVGNVQNGDENDFQVAVSSQFDPTRITLLGTEVIASSVPGINVGMTDSIYFISGNGSNGATVTIRWTFRITGYNFTTYLLPCAGATSGATNYKYALNTALGSGTPVTISSNANPLTITKTSDNSMYGVNATATFTVTIQNPGIYPVTIDRITDQLPTGFVFQSLHAGSEVNSANSTATPLAGATGNLVFEGGVTSGSAVSYVVPAGGSFLLKYTATTGNSSASNLTTTAKHYSGVTELGSSQNTVSVSATLPVKLNLWRAFRSGQAVRLEWSALQESNSAHFEIEKKSASGIFFPIGRTAATPGSLIERFYSGIDNTPGEHINEYRLKMTDQDGNFEYSSVLPVRFTNPESFTVNRVFPSSFTNELHLGITSKEKTILTVSLFDSNGKLCATRSISCAPGTQQLTMAGLDHLGNGIYFIDVNAGHSHHRSTVRKIGAN